jgi:O-antigen/teichoic acid export membrane protein
LSLARRSVVNVVSSAAGTLVPLLMTFFTTPLIIRLLGEDGYGLQNLAGAIGGFLGFLNMGVDIPIAKFLAQFKSLKDERAVARLLDTTMAMYSVVALIGLLVTLAFGKALAEGMFHLTAETCFQARVVFALSGMAFCVGLVQGWGNACLMGLERYDKVNLVQVPVAVLSPLAGVLAILAGLGLIGFVAARIAVMVIGTVFTLRQASSLLPDYRIRPHFHWPTFRQISGYLATGIALRLMGFVSGGLDRALIGSWISVSSVTAYVVQWSLISPIQSVIAASSSFLLPMSSSLLASGERDRFRRIFLKSSTVYALLSCTAFGALFLFGTAFLRLWVGTRIADRVDDVFRLLIVGTLVTQISGALLNNVVLGAGYLRLYVVYAVGRTVLLAAGLLVGIRYLSLKGTGVAYLVAGIADVYYLVACMRQVFEIPSMLFFRVAYARPLVLVVLLTVAAWPIRDMASTWGRLFLLCALFVSAAASGAVIAGIFRREDLARARAFLAERWSRLRSQPRSSREDQ